MRIMQKEKPRLRNTRIQVLSSHYCQIKLDFVQNLRGLEFYLWMSPDSRLGWNGEIEYGGGPDQIRWRLALMERIYDLGYPLH